MSIKWYEEHVESIIRENEQLKFQLKKTQKDVSPSSAVIQLFKQLFSDIPALDTEDIKNRTFSQILEYYRKRQKSKIDFLMEREMNSQVEVIASKSSKILNRTIKEREKKCNICESDVRPSLQLHKRINELERQLKDLSEELKEYQANQNKYLGEIALLRSITKKLQFELAEKMMMQTKIQASYTQKSRKSEEENLKLRRQVCIWRGQYERIWKQHQTKELTNFKEEDCTEMNTSRKLVESSSNNSQVWIIREGEFEHSYIIEDNHSQGSKMYSKN